ncbi:MAG: hypothetical protein ACRD8O_09155 [Bryobacteraceae bacterium]
MTIALVALLAAAELRVVSEFQRVDSNGQVIAADRVERPREILSPLVARNAYASFRILVTITDDRPYSLHIGQNPEDAVRVTVYREIHEQHGNQSIPDRLEPVKLPYAGRIASGTTHTFWLDLWAEVNAPVRRIKVEPQLDLGGGEWRTYPMEVRVIAARAPPIMQPSAPLPRPTAAADASVDGPLRQFLCGKVEMGAGRALTTRRLLRRNALQDMALALRLDAKDEVERIAAPTGRTAWCAVPWKPHEGGPEWYLRVRDFLYRSASF